MNSYEMQEALAEARADYAANLAEERAREMLADPVQLFELVTNYEADIWGELAAALDPNVCYRASQLWAIRYKLLALARKIAEPDAEHEARSTITISRGRVVNRRYEE